MDVLDALPNNTRIRLSELCAGDFTEGATPMARAGRRAVLFALDRHRGGSVGLDLDGGVIRVHAYIDGTPLPLRDGRLHFDAFFGTTAVALLEVQLAYHAAVVETSALELDYFYRKHPGVAGLLIADGFEDLIGAQVLARLDREPGGILPEQRIIDQLRQERLARARAVRERTAAAMVPLSVLAGFFAIEGASDLFLQAFPTGMAADAIREIVKLRRARKAARELERLPQLVHLRGVLAGQQARFLRGLGKLGTRQRHALLEIGKKVKISDEETFPEVLIALMEQATSGRADLPWIETKLRTGHFDGAFVRNFTRYDANPTWRELQMLLDNTISPTTRRSLVSKLAGFRGEEAAEALVHTPRFRRRFSPDGKAFTVSRGDGSLDFLARTEGDSTVVFGEVKNWSGATWLQAAEREKVKEQLRMHEERIEVILAQYDIKTPPEGIHKVLMVEERGWMRLRKTERKKFQNEIKRLGGWKIQVIPSTMLEDTGEFIDRLRKPASK